MLSTIGGRIKAANFPPLPGKPFKFHPVPTSFQGADIDDCSGIKRHSQQNACTGFWHLHESIRVNVVALRGSGNAEIWYG
jgi:hypothetical protein